MTDFVVVAPKARPESNVEFYASGFWIRVHFSEVTRCARVSVWAPVRSRGMMRIEAQDPALEPFWEGVHCIGAVRHVFRL